MYDQVGSLRLVTDSSGAVVKEVAYDTFGSILYDSNSTFSVPFGFAGGLHDRDTGLVRFGLRDYDPALGRWTAKDPIDFAGGDWNLYGYCLGDPVNWVDPIGLEVTYDSSLSEALNRVRSTSLGATLYNELEESKNNYQITHDTSKESFFDPVSRTINIGNNPASQVRMLAHELAEANMDLYDPFDPSFGGRIIFKWAQEDIQHYWSVQFENLIANKLGDPTKRQCK